MTPEVSQRWAAHDAAITACRRCPRLVEHREHAAGTRAQFRGQTYWARPVWGLGDRGARILVVGLAPAAHGANRTGRMFTGDRSGDFLFASLARAGLASQPTSVAADDGLTLRDVFITAAVRCAPPDNRPTPEELHACAPYLAEEARLLDRARVYVCLGGLAWTSVRRQLAAAGAPLPSPQVPFGHLAEWQPRGHWPTVLGSYHPSQQNTFTGRLTPAMMDRVWARALTLALGPSDEG